MKKTYLNALRMSVLFILIIFVSCDPKSGGAGGGGPIEPPPPPVEPPVAAPKINLFTPADSVVNINYTGMPNAGSVFFSWQTSNGKNTYFDGLPVEANDSKTFTGIFEGKDYVLRVVNGSLSPAESTKKVLVVVDPTFAKMCGSTGQSWKTTRNTALFPSGTLNELLQPTELDDTFKFYPNARWVVNFGSLNPRDSVNEDFKFNCITSEIATQPYDLQPVRLVTFISSTEMRWSYTKNGVVYTRYYVKL